MLWTCQTCRDMQRHGSVDDSVASGHVLHLSYSASLIILVCHVRPSEIPAQPPGLHSLRKPDWVSVILWLVHVSRVWRRAPTPLPSPIKHRPTRPLLSIIPEQPSVACLLVLFAHYDTNYHSWRCDRQGDLSLFLNQLHTWTRYGSPSPPYS